MDFCQSTTGSMQRSGEGVFGTNEEQEALLRLTQTSFFMPPMHGVGSHMTKASETQSIFGSIQGNNQILSSTMYSPVHITSL
jgi:hypothetical protein